MSALLPAKAGERGRVRKFALRPMGRVGDELLLEVCGCVIRMACDGVRVLRICTSLPKFAPAYVATVGCEDAGAQGYGVR